MVKVYPQRKVEAGNLTKQSNAPSSESKAHLWVGLSEYAKDLHIAVEIYKKSKGVSKNQGIGSDLPIG
jgi:hypothetical protein